MLEFFLTFRKFTIGGFVNQPIKKIWPYVSTHVFGAQKLLVAFLFVCLFVCFYLWILRQYRFYTKHG